MNETGLSIPFEKQPILLNIGNVKDLILSLENLIRFSLLILILINFFSKYKNNKGDQRFQALAILESILPGNESVERNYSHAWSIWRSETNGSTGKSSQSLFWNLYRSEKTETNRRVSFLFGLFQYERKEANRRYRIFFIPFKTNKPTS